MHNSTRWHVCEDAAAVATEAARRILAAAETAIAARGVFRIVLAGGRTPLRTYRLLSRATADWTSWYLYFSDERCLPPDHDGRNSRATALAWLDRVPIPAPNIHPIPAELGAEAAAAAYRHPVSAALPFDLVTLGMGEDGHTASLFPGQVHPVAELTHPIHGAPKPPPDRVSLSARALSDACAIMILATGAEKKGPLAAWRAGEPLPVAGIGGTGGVDVLIDRDANGALIPYRL
ncbi:6-phosphogluconolactonase [Candidatus Thiosymbion oneisti]|uniref:6-phosphogluconolactonase n=1 Tax=Candidatus Thiosymbion oneisti TaxID=589554 RepID=UPI000AD5276F|nr:6-phosphogluconolactonase [Candidatus Thiosymbion oneisti]